VVPALGRDDEPPAAVCRAVKRLSRDEAEAGMDSEACFAHFAKGELGDDARTLDWANDYRHVLALHADLDKRLNEAA
jgi:hypothetical protein